MRTQKELQTRLAELKAQRAQYLRVLGADSRPVDVQINVVHALDKINFQIYEIKWALGVTD